MDTSSFDDWVTPSDRFFTRSHFSGIPKIAAFTFRLKIGGAVERPFSIGYDELLAMESLELAATLECAGNSRSLMSPPGEGLQFRHGAVSNAIWRGVPLAALLDRAGLKPSAVEVLFRGADRGEEVDEGETIELYFERSLSTDKALVPEVIVAYEMNGEPLAPSHGFPVRLIVPGWYGMASVKWLVSIKVLERPYRGLFQERRYTVASENDSGGVSWAPLDVMKVKSLITYPREDEAVSGGDCEVRGLAWCGEGDVTKVEISADGGRSWQEASLSGEPMPGAWRKWRFKWHPITAGDFTLKARATDSQGNVQPDVAPWNYRGYGNNSIHSISVEVS